MSDFRTEDSERFVYEVSSANDLDFSANGVENSLTISVYNEKHYDLELKLSGEAIEILEEILKDFRGARKETLLENILHRLRKLFRRG